MSYADKFLKMAISQIGYKESGTNINKYSKYFDDQAKGFFNTKKQGAEWCSIFIHWCLCQILSTAEVKKITGEPAKDNCAAGVKYFWNYLKAKKLNVSSPKKGDIIFFNSFGHVGIVEKVDTKIHTIEGNKSNSVKRCSYTNTTTICGYARLVFPAEKVTTTVKIKAPVPATSFNKSYSKSYTTTADAPLINLQNPSQTIATVKKGSSVRCYGYYRNSYLYVVANGKEGYINRGLLT